MILPPMVSVSLGLWQRERERDSHFRVSDSIGKKMGYLGRGGGQVVSVLLAFESR